MLLEEKDFAALRSFGVTPMAEKAREICLNPSYDAMTFEERLLLMIDAEREARAGRALCRLVGAAGFKNPGACVEEVLYLDGRKLDRGRVERIAGCGWVAERRVLALIGKTGCGKSYIAQALGVAACRKGYKVLYKRLHDMIDEIDRARESGARAYYDATLKLRTVDVLIIDDFLTTPIGERAATDLSHVIDAREDAAATLVASILEPEDWYRQVGDCFAADTTVNRLSSAAEFVDIEGPNMREYFAQKRRAGDQRQ